VQSLVGEQDTAPSDSATVPVVVFNRVVDAVSVAGRDMACERGAWGNGLAQFRAPRATLGNDTA
jgi:hypothetical protein